MKKLSTKEILQQNLNRTSPLKKDFILWLHDIRSLHNVGAAFRSADAFGIRELWLSGFSPVPPRPEITKTAIGAEENVNWKQIQSIPEAVQQLKSDGYTIVGLEQTTTSKLLHQYKLPSKKICLVLGNEVTGIGDDLIPHLDASVEIPQFGMKHSLNVSVAGGVALYAFFEKFEDLKNS
ncbi:RNA methyltransferase [Rhodohalobacter barkolensis]|uniref:RNA methyltransferase n=1 Tax=Rhodohalobacter barkolensis TaxID=2053187 RepID=A0A2N0VKV6_9BACT|nr:RNA methyltransferase [Rhodohalobacter barkolensis]PKD44794.1 RNA methyltransferase [Rhodohalobacter barkolensis]